MDFKQAVSRGWRMIQLDRSAVREVLGDENAFVPALVILAIAGAASAIGSLNPLGLFVAPFLVPAIYFVLIGIVHIAAGLLGGSGDYMATYRAYGHGPGVLSWISVIPLVGPFLGLIVTVWHIVIATVIVEENYGLSRGKAIFAVLVPMILFCVCIGGIVTVFFGSMLGLAGLSEAR